MKPATKPNNPCFSSGPCAKRLGWSLDAIKGAALGRSHRAKIGKDKLAEVIEKSRNVLQIPNDYKIGIVPASDTGAVEMAMWSLLGSRAVDIFAFESFGSDWANDIIKELKLTNANLHKADYGKLPDLSKASPQNDIVFTWNGTTSGVKIPDGNWISDDRIGLTICDATSAVFAMDLPWHKLDVVTWSWQKVMGGEAAHGMIVLSPRAVARLESYTPSWPMPKIFRMTKSGKLIDGIFKGETINTPSMLCVEDALDGLNWALSLGGKDALIARSNKNLQIIKDWVAKTDWIGFLSEDEKTISNTSICLKITDPNYNKLGKEEQEEVAKKLVSILSEEKVAYDIASYRDAPTGLRIWGGATIEASDVEKLIPWIEWAYSQVRP